MSRFILSLLLILSMPILSACTVAGLAIGAIAGGGLAAAQTRSIGDAANDFRIQAMINDAWFKYDVDAFGKLDMTVNQARVLITGTVQDPEQRVEAIRLAWKVKGVKHVINEIRVAESSGIKGYAKDAWISAQVRSRLTFAEDIYSVNYSIDTVDGVVYLLGISQSREELNHTIEEARTVSGVKKVVSYLEIVEGDPDEVGQ